MRISKEIQTDTGHRVPNHGGMCCHMHGHRYVIEVAVTGPVSQVTGDAAEGMVVDFSFLKKLLMDEVHSYMDHHFLCYSGDPFCETLCELDPDGVQVFPYIPTAENIALWIAEVLIPLLPEGIELADVRVKETPTSVAIVNVDELSGRILSHGFQPS